MEYPGGSCAGKCLFLGVGEASALIAKTYDLARQFYWLFAAAGGRGPVTLGAPVTPKRQCRSAGAVQGRQIQHRPLREDCMSPLAGNVRCTRSIRRLVVAFGAFAVLLTAGASIAAAQTDYPTKPVRIFVPYGPGGVGDLTMRLVADKLSQTLKQQFVVENRPGAGGIANATAVMRAPPDGYTLIEIGNGSTISMSLFKDLPYNVLTDFASV